MAMVVGDLEGVIVYADDIFLHTLGSFEQHLELLDTVLKRLREARLLIKAKKLVVAHPEIEFCGIIYKAGATRKMAIPDGRVQGYLDTKRPETRKALVSFLASTNYYRRFIPRYADITYPMHKAITENKTNNHKISWTPELTKAYDLLLEAIKEQATMQCPDPLKPFTAFSDASDVAGSFLLFQPDEEGQLKLVGASSKTFSKAEQNRSIYLKELLALCTGLSTWEPYLMGNTTTIYTDARGISVCRLGKNSSNYIARKCAYISRFDLVINHINSGCNLADHASRYNKYKQATESKADGFLTMEEAEKLVKAVLFQDVTITPEDVKYFLDLVDSWPAPVSRAPKPASRARVKQMTTGDFNPGQRSERKIKIPRMSNYSPYLPNQQRLLTRQGFWSKQYEKMATKTQEERNAVKAKEKLAIDWTYPSWASSDDKEYQAWIGNPRKGSHKEENWPDCAKKTTNISPTLSTEEAISGGNVVMRTLTSRGKRKLHTIEEDSSETAKVEPQRRRSERLRQRAAAAEAQSNRSEEEDTAQEGRLPERRAPARKRRKTGSARETIPEMEPPTLQVPEIATPQPEPLNLPPPLPSNPRTPTEATSPPDQECRISQGPQDNDLSGAAKKVDTSEENPQETSVQPDCLSDVSPDKGQLLKPQELTQDSPQIMEDPKPCCTDNDMGLDCIHSNTKSTWVTISKWPKNNEISPKEFAQCQRSDPVIAPIIDAISICPEKMENYELQCGILHYRSKRTGRCRPMLPRALLVHLCRVYHYSTHGLHMSAAKCTRKIETEYYHPRLAEIVRGELDGCSLCNIVRLETRPNRRSGTFIPIDAPRTSYSMDWVSGVPATKNPDGTTRHTGILVVVDLFSNLTRYYPTKSRTAEEAINALKNVMKADATTPAYIRSDNESCFSTEEFQDFIDAHDITHVFTASRSAKSNKHAENAVKALKASLKLLTRQMRDDWDENLHLITMAQGKGPAHHGQTPEIAHFGNETRSAATLLPNKNPLRTKEEIEKLREQILKVKTKQQQERIAKEEMKKDDRKTFKVGTMVYYYENPIKMNSAVIQRYSGPHEIVAKDENSFTCTIQNVKTKRSRKVQIANCKVIKDHPKPTIAM